MLARGESEPPEEDKREGLIVTEKGKKRGGEESTELMFFIFTVVIETMTIIFNSISRLLRTHERNLMPANSIVHFRGQVRTIEEEICQLQAGKFIVSYLKQGEWSVEKDIERSLSTDKFLPFAGIVQ